MGVEGVNFVKKTKSKSNERTSSVFFVHIWVLCYMLLIIFFCYSLKGNCWLVTQMVFLTHMSVLTCFLTSLEVAADELMSRKTPSSQTLKKRNSNFLNILFAFFTL